MVGIDDPYVAYCLDQAVGYLGRSIEAELDKVEGSSDSERESKRQRVLDRFLNEDNKPSRGTFADPAAMIK